MVKVAESGENTIAYVRQCGRAARVASKILAKAPTKQKNESLLAMADTIIARSNSIIRTNGIDLKAGHQQGLSAPLIDRLELTPKRVVAMAEGLAELDNAVIVPHIASASHDTRNKMSTVCAENAVAHSRFERAPHCVNPEVYQTEAYQKRVDR